MNWRDLPDIFLSRQLPEFQTESVARCASALWDMLDDVDTALDMYDLPPDFVQIVSAIVGRRHEHARVENAGDHDQMFWIHQ